MLRVSLLPRAKQELPKQMVISCWVFMGSGFGVMSFEFRIPGSGFWVSNNEFFNSKLTTRNPQLLIKDFLH